MEARPGLRARATAAPWLCPTSFEEPFPTAPEWEWLQGWLRVKFQEARPNFMCPEVPQDRAACVTECEQWGHSKTLPRLPWPVGGVGGVSQEEPGIWTATPDQVHLLPKGSGGCNVAEQWAERRERIGGWRGRRKERPRHRAGLLPR